MLWRKVKTAKRCLPPRAKKRTVTITYSRDGSDEEREKTQNKAAFENDGDDRLIKFTR